MMGWSWLWCAETDHEGAENYYDGAETDYDGAENYYDGHHQMVLKLMGRYSRDQLLLRRAEEFQSWQGGDTSSGDTSDGFDGNENDDEK